MRSINFKAILLIIAVAFLVHSCGNKGQGPTGGPKDLTPPMVIGSSPANWALGYKKKQIEIDFNEYINIDKPTENVVISPPQMKMPDLKASGKHITITLNDELKDTTTYSINFGNAIQDVNEKNPLKNYVFSFSTGHEIDSLSVSGYVIDAETQNPLSGVMVGVYIDISDSAFYKQPFVRIGKTDENGHFIISNVAKGKYRIFALTDANGDYRLQPGEGLAMCDSLIHPTFRREMVHDSIWRDSTHFDSIHSYMATRFLPDDIILRHFKENRKRQYFIKSERKSQYAFSLFFNAESARLPDIRPLNFKWDGKYMLQKNARMDSITFWLTDSTLWKQDTLTMSMTYLKSDSLMRLVPQTDTINVFQRKAKINPKARKSKLPPKKEDYKLSTNVGASFDVYMPVMFKFEAPLDTVDLSKVKLLHKVDTLFKPVKYIWKQVDSTRMAYSLSYKWIPEESYSLIVDSTAFRSIYRLVSNKVDNQFKIKSLDEYSSIRLFTLPYDSRLMVQVIDAKDNVLQTKSADPKGALFEYLKPGDYYLRLFIDENGNKKWDTGEYNKLRQPEMVIYNPKKFTLKANWEFEETWSYTDVPLLKQKPLELKKLAAGKKKTSEM